jgi:hypothetical protein
MPAEGLKPGASHTSFCEPSAYVGRAAFDRRVPPNFTHQVKCGGNTQNISFFHSGLNYIERMFFY